MKERDIKDYLLDLKQTIERLEQENTSSSTMKCQKDCNEYMIKMFHHKIKLYEKRLRMVQNGYYEELEQKRESLLETIHKNSHYRHSPRVFLQG